MVTRNKFMRDTVRPVALACISPALGSLLGLFLELFLDIQISNFYISVITFCIAAFSALYFFPKVLRAPFEDVSFSEYLHRLGFYIPHNAWKHILLGCILAVCTFCGMLLGSLLTGRFQLDWSTVTISHTIFSINPGLWEEFFYRGVVMILLIRVTKSIRRAAIIQIVLFGFFHIKGFSLWAWVDVISVMILALAFTYTAYKTRTLLAGIVFHFLHDVFLFLPQVPGGEYIGAYENMMFFASLWLMVGVACVLVKFSSEILGIKADEELYRLESVLTG